MSIVKLKGRKLPYYAVVSTGKKVPGTKRYGQIWSQHGFASRAEAQDEEARLRDGMKNKTLVKPSTITMGQLLEQFIKSKKGIKHATITSYKAMKNRICGHNIGQKKVQEIDKLDVENFRVWLYDQGMSQSFVRQTLSFLRSACQWACDLDILPKSPARQLQLPAKPDPKGLHIEEDLMVQILLLVKRLMYAEIYIPLLIAGNAGLRISEICGLTRSCIREDGILVHQQYLREGQGVKDIGTTKSRTSVRLIPVSAFVVSEIEAYEEFIDRAKKNAMVTRFKRLRDKSFDSVHSDPAWFESDFLYVNPEDGTPYVRDGPEKAWRKFKRENPEMLALIAEHPELAGMRIHDFRHTFGSNLRFAGAPIEDVSELMGHSDVSFTAKTYALPLKESHKRAMDKYTVANSDLLGRLKGVKVVNNL